MGGPGLDGAWVTKRFSSRDIQPALCNEALGKQGYEGGWRRVGDKDRRSELEKADLSARQGSGGPDRVLGG